MFSKCYSLIRASLVNTSSTVRFTEAFANCSKLNSIGELDISQASESAYSEIMYNSFLSCYSLTTANIKNVKTPLNFSFSPLLSKNSILYLINNEAATSAITIKLATYAYDKWANDADVVAALANHPNISLSK